MATGPTLAALAPTIIETADDGDSTANGIVIAGAGELAAAAAAAARQVGLATPLPVAMAGGLLASSPNLSIDRFLESLSNRGITAEPIAIVTEPAEGAVRLALARHPHRALHHPESRSVMFRIAIIPPHRSLAGSRSPRRFARTMLPPTPARVPRRLGRHRRQHRLADRSPACPPRSRRTELIAILDKAVELKLNAIVFQVRPMADALYESKLEPWCEYLTGHDGQVARLRSARVRGRGSPRARAGTARLVQPVPGPHARRRSRPRRKTTSPRRRPGPRQALRQALLDEPDAPGRAGPLARRHPRRGEALRHRRRPHRRLLLPVQGEGRRRGRSSRSPTTTPGRRTRTRGGKLAPRRLAARRGEHVRRADVRAR